MTLDRAKDCLWRRETHKSSGSYSESDAQDAIVVRDEPGYGGIDHVLYTDFNVGGKIAAPDARMLAEAAIRSVRTAAPGTDGISYLLDLLDKGVMTVLTPR